MDNKEFRELLGSVREAGRIRRGKRKPSRAFHIAEPEVARIREQLGLSQEKFAALIGVSKRTVENWEQGRRRPTGPSRALLKIVAADPERAMKALRG